MSVQAYGVGPDRVVFANPCKTNSMINYAREKNFKLMTFDTSVELKKIAAEFPEAELLIRLQVDDSSARYRLGQKFGAAEADVDGLLALARDLGLHVVGIAFHVGTDSTDAGAFASALSLSRTVEQKLQRHGFRIRILDIGGGYPGIIQFQDPNHMFYQIAHIVNQSLDLCFPKTLFPELRVIAEPGKYFVASALTLVTKIVGKRFVQSENGKECMYYLNDGLFGSFLIQFWEPELVVFKPMLSDDVLQQRQSFPSTVWGPTCDSSDFLFKNRQMKELHVGEYLQVSISVYRIS